MGRTKKVGLGGGFAARYGATVRKRYVEVVSETKKRHTCPKCKASSVKRCSVGIWSCRKCGFTFTGGAYVPSTKLGTTAMRTARALSKENPRNP
ncbi:MAG: 50S ribosomal protein L37ae [Candidatus Bathyarchaeota archaeon]|nr:50S ribosomal protein L37ae [Candidatus Bathyarchaeota archaeon]